MNIKDPISSIMKTSLVTVSEDTPFEKIKEMFITYGYHHLPVVQFKKFIGLISLSDISFLINPSDAELESIDIALINTNNIIAKNIMRVRLGKLEPDDKIEVAIDIFLNNNFHCLPVISNNELVGIVTPNDILRAIT